MALPCVLRFMSRTLAAGTPVRIARSGSLTDLHDDYAFRQGAELLGDVDEGADPAIDELLELAYSQLDGFVAWDEQTAGLDSRTAQQDCYNAEALLDYLANYAHKRAQDMGEFDLRWFINSHYIRKSLADEETAGRLPDSLARFLQYLRQEQHLPLPPWVDGVVADREDYESRRLAFRELEQNDEEVWKRQFRIWCEQLEDDLDARCLWLPSSVGDRFAWHDLMGWREAALRDEAQRNWQAERGELLDLGLDFDAVRERLESSYLTWLDTPQDRLDGLTPLEVVADERAEQPESFDEDETDDETGT